MFGAIMVKGKPSLFSYLIDGTHRAVACVRSGRPFKAFCLNSHETAFCATETAKQIKADPSLLFVG